MNRREFTKLGALLAAGVATASATPLTFNGLKDLKYLQSKVNFMWDGSFLSAPEYADLLMRLVDEGKIKPDYYSNGGIVEELENKMAKLLGKESAVFMPTGTLANHIAVRRLAGNKRRVLVPAESHLYRDSGDCAQTLSNLNLVPLGKENTCYTLDEVVNTVKRTKEGRVETKIGALMIESPVRRKNDRILTLKYMKSITEFANAEGIRSHMDGARLFVQSAHTGVSPAQYSEIFDTVYTSMWKCFNAPSGAILAGTSAFTEGMFNERRMFGGGLPFAWPFAAIALHFVDGFIDEYKAAWAKAESIFTILANSAKFQLEKFDDGTHVVRLNIKGADLKKFQQALQRRNVDIRNPDKEGVWLRVNPSLNRKTTEEMVGLFEEAYEESKI
jgi:threonine aldolase